MIRYFLLKSNFDTERPPLLCFSNSLSSEKLPLLFWINAIISYLCDFFYWKVWGKQLRHGTFPHRRRIIFPVRFCASHFSEPEWRAALLCARPAAFQWLSTAAPANWGTDDGWTWSPPFAAAALSALHPLPLYIHPHRKCGRDWNGSLHIRVILRAAACRSGSKGHVREQLHRHGEAEQKKRTDLACLIVMKELITFQVCFWAK